MFNRFGCKLVVFVSIWGPWSAGMSLGDGGTVRVSEVRGPWRVTLFTAPTPLRAGPIDVSVLVQDAVTLEAILDRAVTIHAAPQDGTARPLSVEATRRDATNKLYYAALFDLPSAGRWRLDATVAGDGAVVNMSTIVTAAARLPAWQTQWPWLVLPAVAIALFAVNQQLRRRGLARCGRGVSGARSS